MLWSSLLTIEHYVAKQELTSETRPWLYSTSANSIQGQRTISPERQLSRHNRKAVDPRPSMHACRRKQVRRTALNQETSPNLLFRQGTVPTAYQWLCARAYKAQSGLPANRLTTGAAIQGQRQLWPWMAEPTSPAALCLLWRRAAALVAAREFGTVARQHSAAAEPRISVSRTTTAVVEWLVHILRWARTRSTFSGSTFSLGM